MSNPQAVYENFKDASAKWNLAARDVWLKCQAWQITPSEENYRAWQLACKVEEDADRLLQSISSQME